MINDYSEFLLHAAELQATIRLRLIIYSFFLVISSSYFCFASLCESFCGTSINECSPFIKMKLNLNTYSAAALLRSCAAQQRSEAHIFIVLPFSS
jgi:hypothetical protein